MPESPDRFPPPPPGLASCPANVELRRLVRLLGEVIDAAADWTDRHAVDGCQCPYCDHDPDQAERVRRSLVALEVTAGWTQAYIDGVTPPTPAERRKRTKARTAAG